MPLVVGAFVRIWGLSSPGIWQDEALSHFYALHDPGWIIRYSAGPINHPPLFFLLLRGWLGVVPTYQQAMVELLNVVLGVLTLGVFYRWVQYSIDWRWAGGLTTVLALHPFHIYYSSELRMYALAGLGLTAMGYFATRLIRDGFRSSVDWSGWVLAALVAAYSHSFTLMPVVLCVLYLGYRAYGWNRFGTWGLSLAVLVGLYFPWSLFVVSQAVRISGDYWLPAFRWGYLWTLVLWMGGFIGPKTQGMYYWLLSGGLVVGLLIPAGYSLKRFNFPEVRLIWLLVLGPVGLVILVSVTGQSVFLYRVFFPLLALLFYGIARGYEAMPVKLSIVCLGVMLVTGIIETTALKNNPPNRYTRQLASWIDTHRTADTLVLHTSAETYFPSRFYHKNTGDEYYVGARNHLGVSFPAPQRRDLGRRRPAMVVFPSGNPPEWLSEVQDRLRRMTTLRTSSRRFKVAFLGGSS